MTGVISGVLVRVAVEPGLELGLAVWVEADVALIVAVTVEFGDPEVAVAVMYVGTAVGVLVLVAAKGVSVEGSADTRAVASFVSERELLEAPAIDAF
jgi:predicted deacylase